MRFPLNAFHVVARIVSQNRQTCQLYSGCSMCSTITMAEDPFLPVMCAYSQCYIKPKKDIDLRKRSWTKQSCWAWQKSIYPVLDAQMVFHKLNIPRRCSQQSAWWVSSTGSHEPPWGLLIFNFPVCVSLCFSGFMGFGWSQWSILTVHWITFVRFHSLGEDECQKTYHTSNSFTIVRLLFELCEPCT